MIETDLVDYGVGRPGVDFLATDRPLAKHIVTNPPYGFGLADRFVLKALDHCAVTGGKVAMLLNLQSLCHPSRLQFWLETKPSVIYALDHIVCWPKSGYGLPPPHFIKHRYCWVVWEQESQDETQFQWLSATAFKR